MKGLVGDAFFAFFATTSNDEQRCADDDSSIASPRVIGTTHVRRRVRAREQRVQLARGGLHRLARRRRAGSGGGGSVELERGTDRGNQLVRAANPSHSITAQYILLQYSTLHCITHGDQLVRITPRVRSAPSERGARRRRTHAS
jgi:hypothetical protein